MKNKQYQTQHLSGVLNKEDKTVFDLLFQKYSQKEQTENNLSNLKALGY